MMKTTSPRSLEQVLMEDLNWATDEINKDSVQCPASMTGAARWGPPLTARPPPLTACTASTASCTAGAYCHAGVQEQSMTSANACSCAARSEGACMPVKALILHTVFRHDTLVAVGGSRHLG